MVKTEKMESLEYSRWEISYFDVQREYSFTDEPKIRKSEFLFLDEFEFEDMALWSEFFSDSELEKLENDPLLTRRDNGFYDEAGHYLIFKCKLQRWIVKITIVG